MATNFSPVLRVLCFRPIPKYCNVWQERILRISQRSAYRAIMALLFGNNVGEKEVSNSSVFMSRTPTVLLPFFKKFVQTFVTY